MNKLTCHSFDSPKVVTDTSTFSMVNFHPKLAYIERPVWAKRSRLRTFTSGHEVILIGKEGKRLGIIQIASIEYITNEDTFLIELVV